VFKTIEYGADEVLKTESRRQAAMGKAEDPEDVFLAELGQRLRKTRALRGMSRKVLAKESGLSERYIAQMESGEGNVSIILLRRLSNAMGAKLEDLLPSADSTPDWLIIRDLLRRASKEQIAHVKAMLSDQKGATRASNQQRVALIGLRGAGKSTLGRIVADRLGWAFVELDRRIEEENGLTIAEILALYGQEGYRRLEQAALRRLIEHPGSMILATGGGIVAEPLTFDLVLSSFFTVWLKAKPEEHMRRVRDQGDLRPMRDDRSAMQELRAILLSREPFYARAHAVVDTIGVSVEKAEQRLMSVVQANVRVAGRLKRA
jgi:XRE family aerobic/anaerobic benzoate catabolism transcriptional regulator